MTRRFALLVFGLQVYVTIQAQVGLLGPGGDVVVLLAVVLVPGWLVLGAVRGAPVERSLESLLFALGLGMASLIAIGLALNEIGPLVGVERPLSTTPVLVTINGTVVIAASLAWIRGALSPQLAEGRSPREPVMPIDALLLFVPLLVVTLAIAGARVLNNGGDPHVAIAAIVLAGAQIIVVAISRNRLHAVVYPWTLLAIGASLVLSYSLRSNYLVGWDVQREFFVFNLTEGPKEWSIASLQDPYNACLSITVLPALLTSLTSFSGLVLFKVGFPVVFAVTPVTIYAIARRMLQTNTTSFLAGVIFVSQTWFIIQAPALARQEVALVLFSLILLALVGGQGRDSSLVALFGIAIEVSHYSTLYVALMLLMLYCASCYVRKATSPLIRLRVVLLLAATAFVWQLAITGTSNAFSTSVERAATGVPELLSRQTVEAGVAQLTLAGADVNTQENVDANVRVRTREYASSSAELYDPASYGGYDPKPVTEVVADSRLPMRATDAGLGVARIAKVVVTLLFPALGLVYLVKRRRRRPAVVQEYLALSVCGMAMIALVIVLPLLKVDYNVTRLYLQVLIILAPLAAIGGMRAFDRLRRLQAPVLSLVIVVFMFQSSGALSHVLGGALYINLANEGGDFDKYYTTDAEVVATRWLAARREGASVYADELASLRLQAYAGIDDAFPDVLPSTISVDSYVFASLTNRRGTTYRGFEDGLLTFDFPTKFLETNKAIVYDNGSAIIYR